MNNVNLTRMNSFLLRFLKHKAAHNASSELILQKTRYSTLFYKQHLYKQRQAELAKNQANAKQHPDAKLLLYENYSHSSSTLLPKYTRTYSKK